MPRFMKKNITKRITALAVLLFAAMVVFTGCSKDEDKDYLYTIGIEDYSHTRRVIDQSDRLPLGAEHRRWFYDYGRK